MPPAESRNQSYERKEKQAGNLVISAGKIAIHVCVFLISP